MSHQVVPSGGAEIGWQWSTKRAHALRFMMPDLGPLLAMLNSEKLNNDQLDGPAVVVEFMDDWGKTEYGAQERN